MPRQVCGTYEGNREYLGELRREWGARQELEEKHPELAGDRRPIVAHEGRFHGAPLRAGDPVPGSSHAHPHTHGGSTRTHGGTTTE